METREDKTISVIKGRTEEVYAYDPNCDNSSTVVQWVNRCSRLAVTSRQLFANRRVPGEAFNLYGSAGLSQQAARVRRRLFVMK